MTYETIAQPAISSFKSTDSRHLPRTLASRDISEGLCKSLWNELADQLWCETTVKMYLPDYSLICFIRGFYSYFALNATPNHLLFQEKKINMKSAELAMSNYFLANFSFLASGQWPQQLWDPKRLLCRVWRVWEKLFLPVHSLPHWKSTAESGR